MPVESAMLVDSAVFGKAGLGGEQAIRSSELLAAPIRLSIRRSGTGVEPAFG
ncbi:hypothetical protein [Halorhodospira abdelmalekii]|uniref:hypothetical protein n=1 Tax=Halorhodospira abdelmalekii TaxID=421629 RepID=UPI0019048CFA|nr:hypothetical protein [Halorhodospira abdelmalekii]